MPQDLPLRCRCGRVRGVGRDVSPATTIRVVCYCDDCQAYARYLGGADVLDAHGGSDICQMAPARLRISAGEGALRCLRLSPKGLYRWYADCCRTPVGNMAGYRVPFVGLSHLFVDHGADGRACDEALGPPRQLIQGRFAVGGVPPGAQRTATFGFVARCARTMLGWWIRGLGDPSALFDPRTRAPRAEVRVLTTAERDALRPAPPRAQAPA